MKFFQYHELKKKLNQTIENASQYQSQKINLDLLHSELLNEQHKYNTRIYRKLNIVDKIKHHFLKSLYVSFGQNYCVPYGFGDYHFSIFDVYPHVDSLLKDISMIFFSPIYLALFATSNLVGGVLDVLLNLPFAFAYKHHYDKFVAGSLAIVFAVVELLLMASSPITRTINCITRAASTSYHASELKEYDTKSFLSLMTEPSSRNPEAVEAFSKSLSEAYETQLAYYTVT